MAKFNHNNSVLRICVDSIQNASISGRVLSRRLTQPMPFADPGNLLLQLDDVFRQQNFPQAFQRKRIFLPHQKEENFAAASPADGMSAEQVEQGAGALTTFELLVISRRNAGWQGEINWLDGSEKQKFSSCLELMRLMRGRIGNNDLR